MDKNFNEKIRQDVGFDIFIHLKVRDRSLNLFREKFKLFRLMKLMRKDYENNDKIFRTQQEFKDLTRMIMEMSFFKKPLNECKYGEEEAIELTKHVKLKYFPPRKTIFRPGDYSNELYFIMRGKVLVGVHSDGSRTKDYIKDKYVERKRIDVKVDEKKQESVENVSNRSEKRKKDEEVFFEGRKCKLVVKETYVDLDAEGKEETKVRLAPDPIYQKVKDLKKQWDDLIAVDPAVQKRIDELRPFQQLNSNNLFEFLN
jgi:hypothetical protein